MHSVGTNYDFFLRIGEYEKKSPSYYSNFRKRI